MLNENKERELAYVVKVKEIRPIPGRDRVECAVVNGWTVMVRKGQFKVNDFGVYFEIDSKVPEEEPFMFLSDKKFKIKTQRYKTPDGPFYSQGLLMSADDFRWVNAPTGIYNTAEQEVYKEGDFLTNKLKITYAEAEDNTRKANTDRYRAMRDRNVSLFKKWPYNKLMKTEWGRKLLFVFFGKKRDKKSDWPAWVKKTDEERCQNMPWLFGPNGSDKEWIVTEKIDGTSATFTMKSFGRKRKFFVCSRNVVFDKADKKCFYDINYYTDIATRYNMEQKLAILLDAQKGVLDYVTIQGEIYGPGVQKRDYSMKDTDLAVFNIIYGFKDGRIKRFNPEEGALIAKSIGLPFVPVLERIYLPSTCEELLKYADGISKIDGGMREGVVLRDIYGYDSFKAVSNEYLNKYHS